MIKRTEYLNQLNQFKNKNVIKVITGIRRSGKSTLLTQFQELLLGEGVDREQIICVSFDDLEFDDIRDYKKLYDYLISKLISGKKNYIFLDEIQEVAQFQRTVNSLQKNPDVDIYITGSNAHMLSSELATLLSGRYVTIHMLPLSFKEYSVAKKNEQDSSLGSATGFSEADRQLFFSYVNGSSMPQTLIFNDDASKDNYLSGVVDSIIVKDIIERNGINDVTLLRQIVSYVAENIGNLISPNKIANTLTSNNRKTSNITVEKYLKALEDSYIIYRADRYDIKGKEHFKTLCKYYVTDLGLRHSIVGKRGIDVGRLYENLVYLELKRRGYNVSVGMLKQGEVDFVATKGGDTIYVQVTATAMDEATLERELKPLDSIRDHYDKILLTMDEIESDYNGIKKLNLAHWLTA